MTKRTQAAGRGHSRRAILAGGVAAAAWSVLPGCATAQGPVRPGAGKRVNVVLQAVQAAYDARRAELADERDAIALAAVHAGALAPAEGHLVANAQRVALTIGGRVA